jgi:hypothetical protein
MYGVNHFNHSVKWKCMISDDGAIKKIERGTTHFLFVLMKWNWKKFSVLKTTKSKFINVLFLIAVVDGETKIIPISQFLSTDMTDNLIVAVLFNEIPDSHHVRIYKVNKRNQVRVIYLGKLCIHNRAI